MALQITDANYEQTVATDKLVVIDFWAVWCGPCQRISPIIDKLSQEYEGKAVITKCDVESCEDLAAKFEIRNVPTILFIKNNEVVDKLVGGVPEAKIREKIEELC